MFALLGCRGKGLSVTLPVWMLDRTVAAVVKRLTVPFLTFAAT